MRYYYPILALLAALAWPATGYSLDHDAEARAAFAMALACESVARKPTPEPDVTPTVKTCHCSTNCVCGCNEGLPCDCAGQQSPVKQAVPTSYATLAECPAGGTYRQSGGRYYPVSPTMTYVQPQQYALPTQRYSFASGGGSCGPGG
jgi:hypothetical protein